ncbi:hypothetical protein Tco_0472993 [Tanacetum coccineum]
MSTLNQQTLAKSGASDRPPMLKKGSYVPWASHFLKFLDNKQEDGERMRCLIDIGPYERKMIPDQDKPNDPNAKIIEPLSKMTKANKKQYFLDIKERIRRLMHGSELTEQHRHSRLVNEFEKFVMVEGESLASIPSYSHSSQPYYVTHPSSIIDYKEDYQGEIQGDAQEDKLTTAMMEKMLLAMKDEARGNLNEEENDFMLDNTYGDDTLEELNAAVILMARIQPTDDKADAESTYDAKTLSEVNALQIHLKSGMLSKGVHEHMNHEKLKTAINTSDDDQIDSSNIFDDPYAENNGGTDEHDSNAHNKSFDIESLIYNIQKEAKNQQRMNNELVNQKAMLQKELKTSYEDLERELSVEKDTTEKLEKEKDKIKGEFFQLKNENLGWVIKIRKNPKRLKKAIAAQPKMYDNERLQSTKVIIDSPDSEETLEDAEESQLKMKDKMIQLDYEKLNSLYETFIPQKEIPNEQTYFSTSFTSNLTFEPSIEMLDLPLKKMPNENKLLQLFVKLDKAIGNLQTNINDTLLKDRSRARVYDDQDVLRQFYKRVASSSSVSRSESKDTNLKKRVWLNTKSKSTSKDVKKSQTKIVNAVLYGSNLVCVSCGKDVFLISHDKCVARYALSSNSRVKRALFTYDVAAKSSKLGATPVVSKSRFSVATPPKQQIRKWQKWFERQSSFNWSPKSSTSQTPSSVSKSSTSQRTNSRTPVTKQKWVAKLATLPSGFSLCGAGDPGTSRFGNDNFAAITGYEDHVQGNLTICHVYYVEGLRSMASECNNSGPGVNCLNFQDSSEEMNEIPSQQDLDNLFGPLYEEFYAMRTPKVLDNFTANTLDNEDTPSSSSIIVEDNDAPQILSSL